MSHMQSCMDVFHLWQKQVLKPIEQGNLTAPVLRVSDPQQTRVLEAVKVALADYITQNRDKKNGSVNGQQGDISEVQQRLPCYVDKGRTMNKSISIQSKLCDDNLQISRTDNSQSYRLVRFATCSKWWSLC